MKRIEYVQTFSGAKFPAEKEDLALQCEVEVLNMDGVEIYDPVKGKYPWDQEQVEDVAEVLKSRNVFFRLLHDNGGRSLRWHFDHMKGNPQPNFCKPGWYKWKGDKLVSCSEEEYQEEVKKESEHISVTYSMLENAIHTWHEYFTKMESIPYEAFDNWHNNFLDTVVTFWRYDMLTSNEVDKLNALVESIWEELN